MPNKNIADLVSGKAFDNEHILAYGMKDPITWGQLLLERAAFSERLLGCKTNSVLIYQPEGVSHLAAMLAVWAAGKCVVIPASGSNQHLNQLLSSEAVDYRAEEHGVFIPIELQTAQSDMLIYTSGSSGAPKPICKSIRQLDAEVQMLERHWGELISQASLFVSLVSRHHMYGLPFGLLWPALTSRPFSNPPSRYLEVLEKLPLPRFSLVVSPAHLDNIPPSLGDIAAVCEQVFCAGAPLSRDSAEKTRTVFATEAHEVYGSTETGAVASRRQLKDPLWSALDGISLAQCQKTACLTVAGPHVAEKVSERVTMGDRVEISDSKRFSLAGRVDKIIKVGGKRVALEKVEGAICSHPLVCEAKVLQVANKKSRLAAVVRLSPEGKALLVDSGKNAVNQQILKHIAARLETIEKPRYWRYVDEIPRNEQGKVLQHTLQLLFEPQAQPRLPDILDTEIDSNELTLSLYVPPELYFFNGHFPGQAILPGVVQLHWALHYASDYFGVSALADSLEVLKFQRVIKPGTRLQMQLTWKPDTGKLVFNYSDQLGTLSNGRVKIA